MRNLAPHYGNQEIFYENFYRESRGLLTKGFFAILWKYPHRVIENNFRSNADKIIVELGAGFGEHFSFVRKPWRKYVAIDLVLRKDLKNLAKLRKDIQLIEVDAHATGLPNDFADRVVATCLIAHLERPELALKEWHRICKNSGDITIYVPCESSQFLKVFRRLISRRKATKQGFKGYDLFILREHINSYSLIKGLIGELFYSRQVKEKRRPFPFLGWYFNLFSVFHIKVEK